jgi:DNA recombination protein RmuC
MIDPAAATLLLYGVSGAVVAALLTSLLWRRHVRRAFEDGLQRQAERATAEQQLLEERLDARAKENARLDQALKAAQQARQVSDEAQQRLATQNAALGAEQVQLQALVDALRTELEAARSQAAAALGQETELRTRLDESARAFAEKEALFRETSAALKLEFQTLANRIFEEQGESFARNNRSQLDSVLSPLREQMTEFKQRVEQVYHNESKDRASLLTEVRNLHRASDRINQEAENLARALKGDKKLQGNWGEMVLERVLDESGLRRDHEYTLQATRRNESGDLKRPDAIIHLPDEKDIVIDSKVSLSAYERALAANDDASRDSLLRQHVGDVRAHVRRLSEQEYHRLQGVRSLDFVLLFVPIESAFMLAMEADQGLFTEAFNRRIVIVSPSTLLMTLRIIHNVWRYEKQSRNAQEIARRAGALYDKLRIVMDDMLKLGSSLQSAEQTYQAAMQKLAHGKGNLVRQVEHFRELGAAVRRPFARELLDATDDSVDSDATDTSVHTDALEVPLPSYEDAVERDD